MMLDDKPPQLGSRLPINVLVFVIRSWSGNNTPDFIGFDPVRFKRFLLVSVPPPVIWIFISIQSRYDHDDRNLPSTYDLVEQDPIGLCILPEPSPHTKDKQANATE